MLRYPIRLSTTVVSWSYRAGVRKRCCDETAWRISAKVSPVYHAFFRERRRGEAPYFGGIGTRNTYYILGLEDRQYLTSQLRVRYTQYVLNQELDVFGAVPVFAKNVAFRRKALFMNGVSEFVKVARV